MLLEGKKDTLPKLFEKSTTNLLFIRLPCHLDFFFCRKLVWPEFASPRRHQGLLLSARKRLQKPDWRLKNPESNSTTITERKTFSSSNTTIYYDVWRRQLIVNLLNQKYRTTATLKDQDHRLQWQALPIRQCPQDCCNPAVGDAAHGGISRLAENICPLLLLPRPTRLEVEWMELISSRRLFKTYHIVSPASQRQSDGKRR